MWGRNAVVETPNIDWIAGNGAICTKFYATSPVCSPSRASFVSGQYPQNTSVVTNNIPMRDDVVTFAEILHRIGYFTGYAGKWHLDGVGLPQWAPKRKFGFQDNRYLFNRGHWKQIEEKENPQALCVTMEIKDSAKESYMTDWLTDKTIEFIKSNRDRSFCYMVSIPDPHGPDTVRAPYSTAYEAMKFQKPRTYDRPTRNAPSWAKPKEGFGHSQSQYYGMVKCIDDNVGRILQCLREANLIDNTIVVFTADHGDLRGEHHRQNKEVPLEASAKVPFVIYYPETIKAGTTVTQALGTVDFLPTILGLMGVTTTGKEEGRDASALLKGDGPSIDWKDITFVRGMGRPEDSWLAAFTSRYKLIISPKDQPWLIDMQQDPDELKNFCFDPEYQEIARTLSRELLDYGKRYNDTRISVTKVAEDLKQLAEA